MPRKRFSFLLSTRLLVLLGSFLVTLCFSSRSVADDNPNAASLPLVTQREAKAIIVIADKPTSAASSGAKILAEHIQQISGAKIPILTENKLKGLEIKGDHVSLENESASTVILVGESNLSKALAVSVDDLGLGGIRLLTKGNTLSLLGADTATHPTQSQASDPEASIYAVITFLEQQLGVRYLWPGESGKVIPKKESIEIKPIDYSYSPIIKQRKIRNEDYRRIQTIAERTILGLDRMAISSEEYAALLREASKTEALTPNWFTWQRAGGTMGLHTGHSYDHMWEKYGKDHPEWFAMQPNGSRDQSKAPRRPRLEVSNPEVWKVIARERIERIDKTKQTSISIDPSDGGYNTFSMSPEAKALDPLEGRKITLTDNTSSPRKTFEYVSLTDRYVYFWNNIAEIVTQKYPDVLLTARAYSAYVAPPIRHRVHPNIVIEQVSGTYFDEGKVQLFLQDWTEWSKMTGQALSWRPNLDTPHRRHGLPTFLTHRMAADVKARVAIGMISADIDSAYKSWSQHSLNLYVLSRLLWDPSLEADEIIKDYCEAGFGAGASFVQDYYAQIEAITEKAADASIDNPEKAYNEPQMIASLVASYSDETLVQLGGLLDQAQKAVKDDPEIVRRLDFLRTSIEYTRYQAEAFRILEQYNKDKSKLDREATDAFMRNRYAMMREILFKEPLSMEIPYLLWGSESRFRGLQSKEALLILSGEQTVKLGKEKDPIADEEGNVENRD